MPDLPELEVVCDVLNRRLLSQTVTSAEVIPLGGAIVVRDQTGAGLRPVLAGIVIEPMTGVRPVDGPVLGRINGCARPSANAPRAA